MKAKKIEQYPEGWITLPECRFVNKQECVSVIDESSPGPEFKLVEASKLSLDDEFMRYEPKTNRQERFKERLTFAIERGVKNFYRPIYDPSFDENGNIVFVAGKRPATGNSYDWWEKAAKEYMSERKSRLGTKNEYIAFLGVLIKKLIASGWSVADAWEAVCDDSKKLGHYQNSENAKYGLEKTGSREVCDFFDLANTYKILAWDDEAVGFWLPSGSCNDYGDGSPLTDLYLIYNQYYVNGYGVGWLVLPK